MNLKLVHLASLKANVGHLEASAAAGGMASLVLMPLGICAVAKNIQLYRSGQCPGCDDRDLNYRLNFHLVALVSLSFQMPTEIST